MLKLRLKKAGRKKKAFYRIVVMDSAARRDGAAIEELGFYDPIEKLCRINKKRIIVRLQQGAQPTNTVKRLLEKLQILGNTEN